MNLLAGSARRAVLALSIVLLAAAPTAARGDAPNDIPAAAPKPVSCVAPDAHPRVPATFEMVADLSNDLRLMSLAAGREGRLYVGTTSRRYGDPVERGGQIWRVDPGGKVRLFVDGIGWPIGLLYHKGAVLVAAAGKIISVPVRAPRSARTLIRGLPYGINHHTNNMILGQDGLIYVAQGDPLESLTPPKYGGTVFRFDPAKAHPKPEVLARGLRNPFGIAQTKAGDILVNDNGPEEGEYAWQGFKTPKEVLPDALFQLTPNADYGYPGNLEHNRFKTPPVCTLNAHGGVTGMTIWRGSLFVAQMSLDRLLSLSVGRAANGRVMLKRGRVAAEHWGAIVPMVVGRDDCLYLGRFYDASVVRMC